MDSLAVSEHPEPLELLQAKRYLTADEVAAILNVPVSTVYEAVRQRRVGGAIRFGRKVRFNPEGLRRWLEGGGTPLAGGWRQEAA
jgi:excisionase family DNA binding protein